MMAQPMKTLVVHYPTIQFLIRDVIFMVVSLSPICRKRFCSLRMKMVKMKIPMIEISVCKRQDKGDVVKMCVLFLIYHLNV